MKRQALWIALAALFALPTGCTRDSVTGIPGMSASNAGSAIHNNLILFETDEFGGQPELMLMRPNGVGRQRLTTDGRGYGGAAISPDGRLIAFTRPNADFTVWTIYVMNADGSGQTPVVTRPGSGFDQQVSPWIEIVDADGTGGRRVTPEPDPNEFAYYESPTWSPDGSRLAFTKNSVLHVINVDGTGMTALPNEDLALNPSWSPDGQRIAYTSLDPFGEIHLRNPDGSNLARVTTGAFDSWPRWAPDSRRLVMAHVAGDQIQTVTINVDGTNAVNLTPAGVLDFMPDWSRRTEDEQGEQSEGSPKCSA
jgi:Tol biopolymer transport system component